MELLRVPPYDLDVTIDVSDASTEYSYIIENMADRSVISGTVTSDLDANVVISLPSSYDSIYKVSIDNKDEYVRVVRPYVDPNTKGTTATEISNYANNEAIARAIIDSIVEDGFYYEKVAINTVGLGADYLPIWKNAHKVLKVYENNVLVYDSEDPTSYTINYELTEDRSAIREVASDLINRTESAPLVIAAATSDSIDLDYTYRGFPSTFDYTVVLEVGHPIVPSDIVKATELLVHDLDCGKLDYYKRYVSQYNTDQFRIQFDKKVFEGTGNIIVDKILSKYIKSIRTIGVL